jgi:cytoskeleton protein RodZ
MSEDEAVSTGVTAGAMLREARQAQGLHIAALAASIKVSQRKLELLEADRIAELPDATFARALAQTVCRSLKIDPTPVLAALPSASGYRLEAVNDGVNTPFRDRPGRHEPNRASVLLSAGVWGPALIALAAGFVYFMPASWVSQLQGLVSESGLATSTPIAGAASVAEMAASEPESAMPPSTMAAPESEALPIAAASAASQALPAQDSSSASVAAAASAAASAAVSAGNLQIRARQDSWIEVMDAQSQPLISRLVRSGELVNLDGVAPLRLKVGNALGTDVSFRGNAIDLKATARDNVARVELK